MMKKFLVLVVLVAAIWVIVSAFGSAKPTDMTNDMVVDKSVVKVGFIGPLSGDAAEYGEPIVGALKIAQKEINDAGGIEGKQIELVVEDGVCDGKAAASAAQKLVNVDKVNFIVGGVCSGEVFGFASILEAAKVVVISPSATNPKISEAGDYIFRNAPSDAARGVAIADYAKSKGFTKVAIISEKTDYSAGVKQTFLDQAKKNGLDVVVDEEYLSDTTDFKTTLSKVKAANPSLVFINPQAGGNLVRIAKQSRDIGIKSPFISTEFNGPEVTGAGAAVDGMTMVVAPALSNEGKGKELTDKYKAAYNKDMTYGYYAGAAYDALYMLANAANQNGLDGTKIKDALYVVRHDGALGTYSFDKNGDITGVKFILQQIVKGKLVNL